MAKIKNQQNISQPFSYQRLYESVVRACLGARRTEEQAKTTARLVCDNLSTWLKKHPEITSQDLRQATTKQLKIFDPEASYLYSQQNLII